MTRYTNLFRAVKQLNILIQSYRKPRHLFYALGIAAYVTTLRDILMGRDKFSQKQLVQLPEPDLIQYADELFVERKYMEVYNLLNQLRSSNVDVLWRMSRALFAMSCIQSLPRDLQKEMVNEAYYLIKLAISWEDGNADVHKWMAILIDSKASNADTYTRTCAMREVKNHLLRATEINPTDITTLYMLGHWCYQLASLTWYQRQLATILFASPPLSSFEEAYLYFLKAEELQPRFFVSNTYMLGKVSFHLKRWYRAKYYLDLAASLPWRTEQEKKYSQEAKRLAYELNDYDVSKYALFCN